MKVVIIYESMLGNAGTIADAIGAGMRNGNEVVVAPAARVSADVVAGADLVVVGAPTHPDGTGLSEWFASLGTVKARAAVFDTRMAGTAALAARASRVIRSQLIQHGFRVVDLPHSFLITGDDKLRPGEAERAQLWGELLLDQLASTVSIHPVGAYAGDG